MARSKQPTPIGWFWSLCVRPRHPAPSSRRESGAYWQTMMVKRKIWIALLIVVCFASCGDDNLPEDPFYQDQWYLHGEKNGAQATTVHINISGVKETGKGVVIAVIDDGLDIHHEDLQANIITGGVNYLEDGAQQTAGNHGTACAGIIAAVDHNGLGIRGVAPDAMIAGSNVLRAASMSNLAHALSWEKEKIWISSNSWGDFNSWGVPIGLRNLVNVALEDGVHYGRNGMGIVYVFSAGNGGALDNGLPTDNVNYSGLVNNRYVIPVCAVDEQGNHSAYSEVGAPLIVCAPSSGTGTRRISTTDIMGEEGYNSKTFKDDYENQNYTKNFGGTSAAAPIVSGVAALMLEANSGLGWRDVRIILAKSAHPTDLSDPDWSINGIGMKINHKYGFGVVDALAAVTMAKEWKNVGAESILTAEKEVGLPIPDNDAVGLTSEITIQQDIAIEFVEVTFNAPDHTQIGDLEVILTSPDGTVSRLAEKHRGLFDFFSICEVEI